MPPRQRLGKGVRTPIDHPEHCPGGAVPGPCEKGLNEFEREPLVDCGFHDDQGLEVWEAQQRVHHRVE